MSVNDLRKALHDFFDEEERGVFNRCKYSITKKYYDDTAKYCPHLLRLFYEFKDPLTDLDFGKTELDEFNAFIFLLGVIDFSNVRCISVANWLIFKEEEVFAKNLHRLPNLTHLKLTNCINYVVHKFLSRKELQNHSSLKSLSLRDNTISVHSINYSFENSRIPSMKNLTCLDISCNPTFGSKGEGVKVEWNNLISLTNLTSLNLNETGVQYDDLVSIFDMLADNANFKSLSLNSNDLGNKGSEVIGKFIYKLKNLEEINLQSNTLHDQEILLLIRPDTGIPSLKKLRVLDIGYNFIMADGLRKMLDCLSLLPEIDTLRFKEAFDNTTSFSVLQCLCKHSLRPMIERLRVLNINSCNITDKKIAGVVENGFLFPSLKNLTTLDIRNNSVSGKGFSALLSPRGLPLVTTLLNLELGSFNKTIYFDAFTGPNGLVKMKGLQNISVTSYMSDSEADSIIKIFYELPDIMSWETDHHKLRT